MTDEKLLELALDARKNAYVPYSGYAVGRGAADGGRESVRRLQHRECGLRQHALRPRRTAAGEGRERGLSQVHENLRLRPAGLRRYPCGACRQSLYEFAPGLEVLVTWDGHVERAPLSELLPHGFGPSSLGK